MAQISQVNLTLSRRGNGLEYGYMQSPVWLQGKAMKKINSLSSYAVAFVLLYGCQYTPNLDPPAGDEQSPSEMNPAARNFMIREYRERGRARQVRQEVAVNQSKNR